MPFTDRSQQRVDVVVVHLCSDFAKQIVLHGALHGKVGTTQRRDQFITAQIDELCTALFTEPVANLVGRLRRCNEIQPVLRWAGIGVLGRDDLDPIARLETGAEWNETTVDPSAGATLAHFGVNLKCEVDRCCAHDQLDHVAFGREYEHLILIKIGLEVRHERRRIRRFLFELDDPVEPCDLLVRGDLFVAPVCGHTVLGSRMHLGGSNLYLDFFAERANNRRVQRLVEVEFRHGDVVLESALHWLPRRVNRSQGCVTIAHGLDDHPQTDQVVDVIKRQILLHHLPVNRIQVLLATGDRTRDVELGQSSFDITDQLRDVHLAFGCTGGHHRLEFCVLFRSTRSKRQILELLFQLLHAESVRKWRVDLERLLGGPFLLPRGQRRNRLHVVQAVRELDDEHPGVLGDGDHHLANRSSLLGLLRIEVHTIKLRHAVDYVCHCFAEFIDDLIE